MTTACPLCAPAAEDCVWSNRELRVILMPDADYPGFCRVIWHAHVAEMTDLDVDARARTMAAVWAVEAAIRTVLKPDKINLASLGNQVPHLHWHVIPRFHTDAHFPDPIWAARRRGERDRHKKDPDFRLLRAALLANLERMG